MSKTIRGLLLGAIAVGAVAPAAYPAAPEAGTAEALASEVREKGWIAYSAPTGEGDWDLFAMRPDGSGRRKITDTRQYNEAGVRLSPDGAKVLYYRMANTEPVDNNNYGTHELVVSDADGGNASVLGRGFPWASWGPGGTQLACLAKREIEVVDLAGRKVVRRLAHKGFVQQLVWSPDGKWFAATANYLGPYWSIGRLSAETGAINAVSEIDRYNCTPDWMPDSRHVVYARGIVPEQGGWAELWAATGDGSEKQLLYAEEGKHIYGACASPDGKYLLFTRSENDLGGRDSAGTRMALMRRSDAPLLGGASPRLRARYPQARPGAVLDLGRGWEPHWTLAERAARGPRRSGAGE